MLRWDFGSVLKEIRKSKGISQTQLGGDELTRFAISKIESNQSIPTVEHMIYILHQLDMTMDEFAYICNEYRPNKRQKLINQFYHLDSFELPTSIPDLLKSCQSYLAKHHDIPIQHLAEILEISLLIQKSGVLDKSNQLTHFAQTIWNRLSQYDTWYWSDFQLIATILYYFSLETVEQLTSKLLDSLTKYKYYKPIKNTQFGLLINLSTIFLYQDKIIICQSLTLSALEIAQELKRYDYLAFAQVRLGICRGDDDLITTGLTLLELTGETQLLECLQNEVKN